MHLRIYAHGLAFLVAVRVDFKIANLYYPVGSYVSTGSLQVEEDYRVFKIQFHNLCDMCFV